jgi:hypothetical protein
VKKHDCVLLVKEILDECRDELALKKEEGD